MSMKLEKMGWLVAASLAGAMVATGFQGANDKVGVVDLSKVFGDSEYANKQTDGLRAVGEARSTMLQFADTYKAFTVEQGQRFRDLSIKANITEAEKAELEKIKKDVIAADKTLNDLSQKASPNATEVNQLNDLNKRKQNSAQMIRRWAQEFDDEVGAMREKMRTETLGKVKDSVKEVGKAGSFTLIFANDVAPYGSNDVTADALKSMNKK